MPTSITIDNAKIASAKVSCRDIYMRLWANRDFEISHVWQRAIFLTAFQIACFAGYGGFALTVITPGKTVLSPIVANGIACFLAFIGLLVSLLWIMMSKGSKMWYENYENAIDAFRKSYTDGFDLIGKCAISDVAGMRLQDITGYTRPELSDWIWSTRGGNFSVSRINIFIGQRSVLVWCILIVVHIKIAMVGANCISNVPLLKTCLTDWRFLFVFTIVALLVFWLYAHFSLKGRRG